MRQRSCAAQLCPACGRRRAALRAQSAHRVGGGGSMPVYEVTKTFKDSVCRLCRQGIGR